MEFTVLGLGEVLWDLLPTGPQLGGAPTNFAYHASILGARAMVVTRVGNDDLGRAALDRFKGMRLPTESVQVDPSRPTGTVTVTLNEKGVAQYVFADDSAWDDLAVTDSAVAAASAVHAVCFGTLGQRTERSRKVIQHLVAAAPAGALKVFDVNLRLNFYSRDVIEQSMRLANVLKINDEELRVLTSMFSLQGNVRQRIEWFAYSFGFKTVVLTRGADGSLIHHDGRWSEMPPRPIRVLDTVGAGDAFAAGLAMGLLNGMELGELHHVAAEMARYVCSQCGGTPSMPDAFRRSLRTHCLREHDD